MTGSVCARVAAAGDLGAIAAIYAPDVDGSVVSFETRAPDLATWQERFDAVLEHGRWVDTVLMQRGLADP